MTLVEQRRIAGGIETEISARTRQSIERTRASARHLADQALVHIERGQALEQQLGHAADQLTRWRILAAAQAVAFGALWLGGVAVGVMAGAVVFAVAMYVREQRAKRSS